MDKTEKSMDSLVAQQSFFNLIKDSSQSPDEGRSLAKHSLDTIMHQDHRRPELYCSDSHTEVSSTDHSEEVVSAVQKNSDKCPEISDCNAPCTQLSSPISALSPVAALVPPTQQVQEQTLPEKTAPTSNEGVSIPNDSPSIGCQVIDYASEKDCSNNYSFTVSQEDSYHALLDEDSCDASYLQSVSDSAVAFNQQYREKRSEEESSVVAEPFSPEAFFSSIPLFKKLQKKPATVLPKLYTTDSPSFYQYEQAEQCFSIDDHGVMSNSKPSSTLVMHGSNQGVPIAPKPDPNTKVPCYVLVVPAPLYYENSTPQDSLQIQQEHQEASPTDAHFAVANIGATPEALHLPHQTLTYPPEWTPQPQKPARTSLPSTRIRVSPSPNKSSRSSPIITVSTTSTPIQPLQGNRQQYVIVQGNNRHLKGIARYKDSFRTPTVEENHQPIYLQGLPPQGFRRFWKSKEGSCTERPTKRSLAPLFSKVSPSDGQEATVPQAEKSPLTYIRSKLPCDREVPETDSAGGSDSKCLANENKNTSTSTPTVEETGTQIITASKVQECHRKDEFELPVNFKSNKSDEITTTPTPKTRHGEDREKKKIRDRRYDAELKKAFDQLRELVPRLQKSSSRGLILQETIKYIGILEKKVLGAGLWSTLQSVETAERNTQSKSPAQATIVEKGVSEKPSPSAISDDVTDTYSNVVADTEREPLALTSEQEKSKTVLNSPFILIPPMSLSTEKLSYSFVSHEGSVVTNYSADTNEEGVTVEEVPLSIPFQQVQLLAADQSDKTPVLTARSPDEPLSKEPHTRLIPVVEIPGYTESSEYLSVAGEDHKSPQWDVFLSAMTTISQEGLTDLGVTLSPLLSPLGILLSPGEDRSQGSSITAEVECEESTEAEAILNSAFEDDSFACSGGMSGICTDMTSIAASVEITTEERDKSAYLSTSNTRRKSRLSQVVPSLSPPQVSDDGLTCRTHRSRNRAILQDHSNFTDAKSAVDGGGKGRQRRLKDHLLRKSSNNNADENSAIVVNQCRTPPGRVSGVLLKGKRKTARSPRGGVGMKRGRRI